MGLYLSPPEHTPRYSVATRRRRNKLRTAHRKVSDPSGRCGTMTHDYKRNGNDHAVFCGFGSGRGKVIAPVCKSIGTKSGSNSSN